MDIKSLSSQFEADNSEQNVMWMGKEAFGDVYRYMLRYIGRYGVSAFKLLFSLYFDDGVSAEQQKSARDDLRAILQRLLRNSDIMMQAEGGEFFLMLPEISEDNIGTVMGRIDEAWGESEFSGKAHIHVEHERISGEPGVIDTDRIDWVCVVDDDMTNLQVAGHTLSSNGMRVSAIKSGEALVTFLKDNTPDLILLDIRMPGMDGFETIQKIRELGGDATQIPVIFLTADDDEETEKKGLMLGAYDFIKKPIMPEVLSLRVRHTIELVRLQHHLSREVDRKTEENERIFIHVVRALAEAIDAKDKYTNGHSSRVAEYSKEIAERIGYSAREASDIYMMGLLHDVGKIGVPDEIINKPARLSDEEFEMIKQHPVIGSRILSSIQERPKLATGARYHHERYGGGGYPDGLSGDDIPEEARIIAVADAYDAMTSRRSYRDVLPQDKVREEIERGIGTQFDPRFAEIMLQMIDEDTDYRMREE